MSVIELVDGANFEKVANFISLNETQRHVKQLFSGWLYETI